jgi:hypothetical protein
MHTEIINVTPNLAREYLSFNTRNRRVRSSHVERLRASFERGEYVMTHQGIAFCSDRTVADGQHRLLAIAALPDTYSFPMLVTTGLDHEQAFPVIDIVNAGRSIADVMAMDKRVAEVGTFFCRIACGASFTPTQAAPYIGLVAATTDELIAFCGGSVKTWSSAPVKAAAVYSLMTGVDSDYVKLMYRSLVHADFVSMPPVITALFRSHLGGRVRAGDSYDIFVRCVRAFNPKSAQHTKIQVKDQAAAIASVRAWLDAQMTKKNAPTKAGAKEVKARANSILRMA